MNKILLLIPRCMCNMKCTLTVKIGTFGYDCESHECNVKCQVYQLKKLCELYAIDYKVASDSSVKNIIKECKPNMVIGIACEKELIKFNDELDHSIKIINGNCKNSEINLSEIENLFNKIKNEL